jgi:integrase/recombinase XerC
MFAEISIIANKIRLILSTEIEPALTEKPRHKPMTTQLIPIAESALVADQLSQLVTAFYDGLGTNTLRAYQQGLADFAAFVGAADVEQAAHILLAKGHGPANHLALGYRANLVERDLSASTIKGRLAAVLSLTKLARTIGLIDWTLEARNVKTRAYRDTRGPGVDGFRALLAHLALRDDEKSLRDRAIIRLLFERALRRNDVASLDVAHLDLDAGTVSILGKGNSERETLTLPDPTRRAITEWLAIRGTAPGPLFPNLDRAKKGSGRLTGAGIWALVTASGKATGQTVRPHGLRHAAITTALDMTRGDVRAVQRFSRHAKVDTLLVYDDSRRDLGGAVAKLVAGD